MADREGEDGVDAWLRARFEAMSTVQYYDPDGNPLGMWEWAELYGRRGRTEDDSWWRRHTAFPDGVEVSTVWLGLDHSFMGGPPLYWETMIFGGEHDEECFRHPSKEAAFAAHDQITAAIRDGVAPAS